MTATAARASTGPQGRGRRSAGPSRLVVAVVAVALAVLGACGGSGDEGGTPTLTWYVYDEPSGSFEEAARRCTEASGGEYRIDIAELPNDADQQRELLVRRLAANDSDIDIIGMDTIWTAEFAEAGWIRPWPEERAAEVTEGRLDPAVESATWDDRLWAAPFTGNAQLLWWRDDLVDAPPATMAELIDVAEGLDEGDLVLGQGARYEGLTVFFNTLLASAGGTVVDESGSEVTLEEEPTRAALEAMRAYATSPAAPGDLSTAMEDQARLTFETGDAAFMLNYPFVYPSARDGAPEVFEHMRWARFPGVVEGEPSHVTYGGFNLGVAAYGDHPDLAFDAVACLTQPEHQKIAATEGGLAPTTAALYDDPAVRETYPFADDLRATLAEASQRPKTPVYSDVSLAIARTLHPMRGIDPDEDVERLRDAVGRALDSEGLM